MTNKLIISIIANTAGNIGRITLNKPKALNALDMDMISGIMAQLARWRTDTSIAAVFIDSEHEKAFCAGGDIVSIYQAMVQSNNQGSSALPDFLASFFEQEYRLDYCLHAYPKPIICWGNGIIMGGGLGIFSGGSIKVVTQTARVAMPEITIGLFPDAGASYFLNRTPAGVGRFLGLTATQINAKDCINIGLADHLIFNDRKSDFIAQLSDLVLVDKTTVNVLCETFADKEARQAPNGNLDEVLAELASIDSLATLSEVETLLANLAKKYPSSSMLKKALTNFVNGSPLTAHLVLELLERAKAKTLAQCFEMELCMAYQCCVSGEFQEGVRALLIDKDKQAKWLYPDFVSVEKSAINAHFSRFTSLNNPLRTLEQDYGEHHG